MKASSVNRRDSSSSIFSSSSTMLPRFRILILGFCSEGGMIGVAAGIVGWGTVSRTISKPREASEAFSSWENCDFPLLEWVVIVSIFSSLSSSKRVEVEENLDAVIAGDSGGEPDSANTGSVRRLFTDPSQGRSFLGGGTRPHFCKAAWRRCTEVVSIGGSGTAGCRVERRTGDDSGPNIVVSL